MTKDKKAIPGITSINRKGVVYWYARLEAKKVYCGKDEKGKQIAEAARGKYIARQYEDREVKAGLKVKRTQLKTVQELVNWYMLLQTTQDKKGYSRKVRAMTPILQYFGKYLISNVEGDEQEKYRSWRKNQGVQDTTIDYEIAALSASYHAGIKRKQIPITALPGEFVKNGQVNPRRLVTDDEIKGLLESATPDFKDFLICGYESAMRGGEIAHLTSEQIHLGVKHISGKTVDYLDLGIFDTKNKVRRTVPVSAKLKEVLKRRMADKGPEELLFTENGNLYHRHRITYCLKTTCAKAGIPYGDKLVNKKGERIGIVFHCLRHTRISKWVEMGFSDEIIRRASGHRSLESYQRYIKLDAATVMRLVESERDINSIKTLGSLDNKGSHL